MRSAAAVDQPALARSWQQELVRSPRNGIHYSAGHQKLSSTNSKSQIWFSKPFVKVENIFAIVNFTFDSGLHWDLVAKGPDHLLQEERAPVWNLVDATLDLLTRSPHFLSAAAAAAAANNLTPSSKFAKHPGTLLPPIRI